MLDLTNVNVYEALKDMTGGRGPDACIDAVGMEAHGNTIGDWYDKAKTATMMATDRLGALRQAIHCCRKGGTVRSRASTAACSTRCRLAPPSERD